MKIKEQNAYLSLMAFAKVALVACSGGFVVEIEKSIPVSVGRLPVLVLH